MALRASAALAIVYGLYVFSTLAFLHLGGLRAVSLWSDDVQMDARGGYSVWPGVFVVDEPKFRLKDHIIEMEVTADRATLDFAPTDLFQGQLHVERLRAQGTHFRLLHRVHDGERNRERIRAFPKIFGRSPVIAEEAPSPRPLPFSVRFSDVEAELREAWLVEYRATGHLRASGSFVIGDDVRVEKARVEMTDTDVHVGERQAIDGSNCKVRAHILPFPSRGPSLDEFFSATHAEAHCDARLSDLSVFDVYLPHTPVRASGSGHWTSLIRIEGGKLVSSHARLDARDVEGSLAGRVFRGHLNGDLRADASGRTNLTATIAAPAQNGDSPTAVDRARLDFVVGASLISSPQLERLVFSMKGASLRDPDLLPELLPRYGLPRITVEGFDGEVRVLMAPNNGVREFSVEGDGSARLLLGGEIAFSCDSELSLACEVSKRDVNCDSSHLTCRPASFALPDARRISWTSTVQAKTLRLSDEGFESRFDLRTSNPKSALGAVAPAQFFPQLGVRLLPLGPVTANGSVVGKTRAEGPPILSGTLETFASGCLRGRARFTYDRALETRWLVEALGPTVGIHQYEGGVRVKPFAGAKWLDSES